MLAPRGLLQLLSEQAPGSLHFATLVHSLFTISDLGVITSRYGLYWARRTLTPPCPPPPPGYQGGVLALHANRAVLLP